MSEKPLNQALRCMRFTKDKTTAHGFRASASSLLNESGRWSPDAIEAELAHVIDFVWTLFATKIAKPEYLLPLVRINHVEMKIE